ncbi:MAG TPA: YlxR family protein [Bacillota bacterium]|nr:YlxR family protein [Bacillota bacterium]
MQRKRKVPLRKCLGCNEMKPKRELIRIVRSPEGKVDIDKVGKAPGRGCYICPDLTCLEAAIKAKRVENVLEAPVDEDVFNRLRTQLSHE